MADENKKLDSDKDLEHDQINTGETPAAEESVIPLSELSELRRQLESMEQEARANYERFLRQAAELENFKKRVAREREETIRNANEYLIRDLLPILDNLERAIAHASGGNNGGPLVEGVELVLKGLLNVLNKHGVVQLSSLGQTFDPAKHEAVAQVESAGHLPNTVVEEHHKGYLIHDRLLRPALVSVAKPPITNEKKNDEGKVENGSDDD